MPTILWMVLEIITLEYSVKATKKTITLNSCGTKHLPDEYYNITLQDPSNSFLP